MFIIVIKGKLSKDKRNYDRNYYSFFILKIFYGIWLMLIYINFFLEIYIVDKMCCIRCNIF